MKEKLQEDLKNAMKSRDQLAINTLRGLMSEIKKYEIDTKQSVDAEKFVALVQKEVKKRRDALEFAKNADRAELVEQNQSEIKLLQAYLGDQMSEEQLKTLIESLVSSGMNNVGAIMGALNKDHKGKFEGKMASEIVKSLLAPAAS